MLVSRYAWASVRSLSKCGLVNQYASGFGLSNRNLLTSISHCIRVKLSGGKTPSRAEKSSVSNSNPLKVSFMPSRVVRSSERISRLYLSARYPTQGKSGSSITCQTLLNCETNSSSSRIFCGVNVPSSVKPTGTKGTRSKLEICLLYTSDAADDL